MRILILTASVLLLISFSASGGQTRRSQSQEFASFLATFSAAVHSSDKETVASLTKLPFMFEGEELDRTRFIAKFDSLFDKPIKKCLFRSRPVRDGVYMEVTCGETTLMFQKIDGKYRFVDIGVND